MRIASGQITRRGESTSPQSLDNSSRNGFTGSNPFALMNRLVADHGNAEGLFPAGHHPAKCLHMRNATSLSDTTATADAQQLELFAQFCAATAPAPSRNSPTPAHHTFTDFQPGTFSYAITAWLLIGSGLLVAYAGMIAAAGYTAVTGVILTLTGGVMYGRSLFD